MYERLLGQLHLMIYPHDFPKTRNSNGTKKKPRSTNASMASTSWRPLQSSAILSNSPSRISITLPRNSASLVSGLRTLEDLFLFHTLKGNPEFASSLHDSQRQKRGANMNQNNPEPQDEMRPEYDFSNAVRGRHFEAFKQGTNLILLDSDVAGVFKDSASVNEALRLLLRLAREQSQFPHSA